jgi:hypothetical protein
MPGGQDSPDKAMLCKGLQMVVGAAVEAAALQVMIPEEIE